MKTTEEQGAAIQGTDPARVRYANGHQAMLPEQTDNLPVNPMTNEPIPPMPQPGYYPGFDTLSQQAFWDEATRKVVLKRVYNVPPIRFFTADQAKLMQAIIERVIPQDDRDEEHQIPVLNYLDEKLYLNQGVGYRFEDMPPDREAYQLGMQAIDEIAHYLYEKSFVELNGHDRDAVLKTLHEGKPPAGDDVWKRMPVVRFWALLVQDCAHEYYAHPYAWNEIGFGGPSYPRGYMRLNHGKPEPWEADESRYEWAAPPSSLSGETEPFLEGQDVMIGQGGTH